MLKKLFAGALIAASLSIGASVVSAASVDFSSNGNGAQDGEGYKYTGSDGTMITTSVLQGVVADELFFDGVLNQTDSGLGICIKDYEGICVDYDNPEIDGWGNEGIRLTFSQEVFLNKIYFTAVGRNDDFSYRVGDGNWVTVDIEGGNGNDTGKGYYEFSLPGLKGSVFDIAAIMDFDDFKVSAADYEMSAVPLPPAVLLFGAALMGLGWFKRRKSA
ncbi:PEP-CTERM sorting domain-containing protein [Sneathiella limimaris]|uniref:PEP-CTERM sorting domain-containing protein n=1 Tax=Sneathiella limimaris TaxID=1964213 RepID=UPI00146A9FD2|nr:PEP-CTERM sorting domain-containing protein [Sneathiella limimaris]